MNLTPIAANMTEVFLAPGKRVLFSYKTPVACVIDGVYYKTEKKWSNTTTRHINKWLPVSDATVKPQEYFDNLLAEVK
jgi:hypothetical protein